MWTLVNVVALAIAIFVAVFTLMDLFIRTKAELISKANGTNVSGLRSVFAPLALASVGAFLFTPVIWTRDSRRSILTFRSCAPSSHEPWTAACVATDPEFAAELPRFQAAVWNIFNPYELAGYLTSLKPSKRKKLRELLYVKDSSTGRRAS